METLLRIVGEVIVKVWEIDGLIIASLTFFLELVHCRSPEDNAVSEGF